MINLYMLLNHYSIVKLKNNSMNRIIIQYCCKKSFDMNVHDKHATAYLLIILLQIETNFNK